MDKRKFITLLAGGRRESIPWYLAGGISPSDVAGVWRPYGAANLAASYLRVAGDLGNANLDPAVVGVGLAPDWDPQNGWKISPNQFLDTGIVPTESMSMVLRFTNNANALKIGSYSGNETTRLEISTSGSNHYYCHAGTLAVSGYIYDGVFGISGQKGYKNGVAEAGTIPGPWSGLPTSNILIGKIATSYGTFYLSEIAIYKNSITALQQASIYEAINRPAENLRLVVFGDSITAGSSASSAANRYANIYAANQGLLLINSGISNTILQNTVQTSVAVIGGAAGNNGRDSYANRVTAYSPSRVIILYGLNDIRLNDAAITVGNFQNDLGEIVDALVASGIVAQNITIGSPPYNDPTGYALYPPFDGGSTAKHETYVAAVAAVASAKGTKYADVYQAMIDNGGNSLLNADKVHPNDAGHAVIAASLLGAA